MSLLVRFIERVRLALTREEWAYFVHRYIQTRGRAEGPLPPPTGAALIVHERVLRKLRASDAVE